MKKILLLATTLLVSSSAFADAPAPVMREAKPMMMNPSNNYYAKIEVGASKPKSAKFTGTTNTGNTMSATAKYDTKMVAGIGGGYRFNEFFRSDLMLQYTNSRSKKQNVDIDKNTTTGRYTGKTNTINLMLNGYLDANNDTIFTPYVMAGIGIGRNETKITAETYSMKPTKTNFIWNIGLGVQAKIQEQTSLGLEYRYVNFGKLGSKSSTVGATTVTIKSKDLAAHQLVVGLTYDL